MVKTMKDMQMPRKSNGEQSGSLLSRNSRRNSHEKFATIDLMAQSNLETQHHLRNSPSGSRLKGKKVSMGNLTGPAFRLKSNVKKESSQKGLKENEANSVPE